MANDTIVPIADLKCSERIVPPIKGPPVLPFQLHQYPLYGNATLLVIPTANESKRRLLQDMFTERATPHNVTMHTITVPVDSEVGEQPYNDAGVAGAYNRISNALVCLDSWDHEKSFGEKSIGTVIVESIESYIQLEGVDRPTDYGIIVIHNVTTQRTTACSSWGVTVAPAFVNRARRFGFQGNPNHGRVTVGQILAANVPGLDKADWQAVLAGRSRYDLLKDAIIKLPIPW
jgi:non-canonical (house-cleaning) NTP pyrophosphatase